MVKSALSGRKVRIGIIGAGDIADRKHIPNFNKNMNCQIISICSRNKQNALRLFKKYNIPDVDDSYESLLKRPDIDAVSICTPPYTHKEIIHHAILNNKHILVEKPMTLNLEEAEWVLKKVSNYSKKFMVSFNNRYRSENLWVKERIKKGEIGTPHLVDLEWLRTKREINKRWLFRKNLAGGGVFSDLGIHLLDFVLGVIKDRKKFSVYGCCKKVKSYDSSDVEDLVVAVLIIDDRIVINLKLCWALALKVPARVVLRFYGDKGEISNLDYKGKTTDGYSYQIDNFVNSIINDSKINHKIYLDAMRLMDAIYMSCENNDIVTGKF